MLSLQQSILQEVHLNQLKARNIEFFVKRDDLIHSEISGNKWRKLKYSILHAEQQKFEGILTFGGAFSNHLVATAAACQMKNLRSIGIVRGEELTKDSNDTLKRCAQYGMDLHFVSRTDYAFRNERMYQEELTTKFPSMYIVPEGGANYLGIIGCSEILSETSNNFDIVVVAQGTTTTSAGLLMSLPEKSKLWAVPVLKGFNALAEMKFLYGYSAFETEIISDWLSKMEVLEDYHFGGYGKYTSELLDFIESFYNETNIPLDPVYTSKAVFALLKEIEFRDVKNKRILFVHTGGIQGAKSIFEKEKRVVY
jgi:1-aminocyclopropane-1-carboxylate deaminase